MKKSILFLSLLLALPIHGIENSSATKKKITLSKIELIGGIATAILIPILCSGIASTHVTKRLYDHSRASGKDVFDNEKILTNDKRNEYFAKSYTLRNRSYGLHALLAGTLVAFGFCAGRISHTLFKKKKEEKLVNLKTS